MIEMVICVDLVFLFFGSSVLVLQPLNLENIFALSWILILAMIEKSFVN